MADVGASSLHTTWLATHATPRTRPPMVLLHGFTQNVRCWGPFGDALGSTHSTLAVDAPGHGESAHVHADLWTTADLLADTLGEVVGRPAVVVGYSMGGRVGLHLALRRPDLVTALVLIGATAGIDDQVERDARRAADDALADHVLAVGLDRFINEWLAQDLFSGLTADNACRIERLHNTPEGLASSLRLAGTGNQEPLWDRLGVLSMPVLVLAGADDLKFRSLANRLVASIGANATVEVVEGAGHAVQLECPSETAVAIERWLADLDLPD